MTCLNIQLSNGMDEWMDVLVLECTACCNWTVRLSRRFLRDGHDKQQKFLSISKEKNTDFSLKLIFHLPN